MVPLNRVEAITGRLSAAQAVGRSKELCEPSYFCGEQAYQRRGEMAGKSGSTVGDKV